MVPARFSASCVSFLHRVFEVELGVVIMLLCHTADRPRRHSGAGPLIAIALVSFACGRIGQLRPRCAVQRARSRKQSRAREERERRERTRGARSRRTECFSVVDLRQVASTPSSVASGMVSLELPDFAVLLRRRHRLTRLRRRRRLTRLYIESAHRECTYIECAHRECT